MSTIKVLSRVRPVHEANSFSFLAQVRLLISSSSTTMALKRSPSNKALESPFSHVEMYGREHPVSSKVSTFSSGRQRLPKAKSSRGVGSGNRSKASSAKSFSSVSTHGMRSSTAPRTVDSKNKKGVKVSPKVAKESKNGMSWNRNETETLSTSTSGRSRTAVGLIEIDHDSPVLKPRRTARISQFHQRIGKWKHSKTSVRETMPKNTIEDRPAVSKLCPSGSATSSKSLLARSTFMMSTSEVLLSFNKEPGNVDCSTNVRLCNRTVKNNHANVPPSVHLPKRAFIATATESSSSGRTGKRGLSNGGSLTIEDIGMGLGKMQYQNVIVMSGAGISTTSGIPDFRTPGTGLYDNLQQYKIPDPTAIFDITFFVHNPKPFLILARELYPGRYQPNTVHHFVRLLQEKEVLLRNYTQNIDGLERLAGLKSGKLVEAHGSFSTASCIVCKAKQDPEQVKEMIFNGQTPRCKHRYCYGLVKPDIVFFGEDLPQRFHTLQLSDFAKCDLLIIMGTSLEVEPFASLASLSHINVPRVLINRELVGPFKHRRKRSTDVAMTGDLVECVSRLATMAGWEKELEALVKGAGVDFDESSISPSTNLLLQSASSSTAESSIPHSRPENRDSAAISEEELSSSLSALSLTEESRSKEGLNDVTRASDRQKDSSHKRSEKSSGYNLRGKGTQLTAISEVEEETTDNEVLEWSVSDVFGGLDDDSTRKSKK